MATSIALKIAPVVNSVDNVEPENYLESASEDEQDSQDEKKHEKLLKDISSLGSVTKKRRLPERSEPSRKVSEFHLSAVKENEEQVGLSDLIGSLSNTDENRILKRKLHGMHEHSDTLDVPLPTPESQKIQRVIAFGQAKMDVYKWEPIVKKNREAEHLSFPLKHYTPPVPTLKGLRVNFKPRTPLEEEVAAVLSGSSHVLERNDKELTADEEKALQAMDFEEAKERRKELQKFRVLQSYYEAKCRRIKRIKSKSYRRVRRRAEMRAGAKLIAEGEDVGDDAEADKVLEKAERMRIQERATLKHRNMSKWSRYLINKAKDSSQAKKLLQEELRFSRKLTEKRKPLASETESDEEISETPAGATEERKGGKDDAPDEYGGLLTSKDNPWRLQTAVSRPQPEAASSGVEHDSTARLHRLKEVKSEIAKDNEDDDSEDDSEEMQSEDEFEVEMIKPSEKGRKKSSKDDGAVGIKRKSDIKSRKAGETAKKRKKVKKIDKISGLAKESVEDEVGGCQTSTGEEVALLKRKRNEVEKKNLRVKSKDQRNKKLVEKSISTKGTMDKAFGKRNLNQNGNANSCYEGKVESSKTVKSAANDIRVDPKKIFRIEDHGNATDETEGDSLQQRRIDIQRAFANDDVVEEFVKNKCDAEKAHQPKDIDMTLPGWGSWAGVGIAPSEEKKKKFIKKADPAPPRKDKDLAHVIINEDKSKLLAQNQVTEVPYPYTHHVQFERSIRNPVGKHWNTSTAVEQLTKPRVSSMIGTIIDPIKAPKEIKKKKDEDKKEKKKRGTEASGITIHN